jgi:hypothetical protein
MDYKTKFYLLKLSRKIMAARLSLSYSALNARLNSFTPWKPREETELRRIIEQAEQAQAAGEKETEQSIPYFQK